MAPRLAAAAGRRLEALVLMTVLSAFLLATGAAAEAGKAPVPGQEPPGELRAEFWADTGGLPSEGAPTGVDEAARGLVDEAAYVWSGLLYGFDFEWTPSDLSRGIAESFTMRPIASIARGDPRLVPEDTRRAGDRIYCYVSYAPSDAERSRLEAYARAPWRSAQGTGSGDYFKGQSGRIAAYEDAAKAALRALLRTLEPNKPRRVRGRLAFSGVPVVGVVGGAYRVQARFRVEVVEVLGYGVY